MKNIFFTTIVILLLVFPLITSGQETNTAFTFEMLEYPLDTKKITVNGLEIAYVEAGKGKTTLLFVHGLGSYIPAWQQNIQALQTDFRCIALDLPGYGKSAKPKEADYSMSFYAKTLSEFIQALNLKNVVLVGHSMGGQIALTTALQFPETLKALILIAPAGIETFEQEAANTLKQYTKPEFIQNTTETQIRSNVAINFVKMPENANFMAEDRIKMRNAPDFENYCIAVSKSVAGMLAEPVFEELGKIQLPVLVVYGTEDKLIPNRFFHPNLTTENIGNLAKENIPQATLVMIAEAGHFVNFEQAEQTNTAIINFLKNL